MDTVGIDRDPDAAGLGRDRVGRRLHHEGQAGELAVEELGRPQLLDELDIEGQRASFTLGGDLDILRPQPTSTAVCAGRSWRRSRASRIASPSATMPGPSIVPGRMFIGGEPMKVATNLLAGFL